MNIHLNGKQKERVLQTIDDDLEACKLWAMYHHALATTGMAVHRKVSVGGANGRELTATEKIRDSLNTMKSHILRHDELSNLKKQLLGPGTKTKNPDLKVV